MASPKKSALFRLRWLLLAPIPLVWCIVAHFGFLSFLEDKVTDWKFQYRGPIDAPVNVVYVNMDALSLSPQEIGGWPWSREYFALVARTLTQRAGVKVIGMDIVFSDAAVSEAIDAKKLVDGNRALGRFLNTSDNVLVGASYTAEDFRDPLSGKVKIREFPDITRPDLPPLNKIEPPEIPSFNVGGSAPFNPPGTALIDTVESGTRWVMLFAPTYERTYYAMALEMARIYYGVERDGIRISDTKIDLVRPNGTIATSIPLFKKQMVEINWFSKWADGARNPFVGFSTVYNYCLNLDSDDPAAKKTAEEFFAQFKDAVVLIGPTDRLQWHDTSPTPMDENEVPRVSVHGNLFKTIISGKYLRHLTESGAYAVIFLMAALVSVLAVAGGGRAVFAKIMAGLSMVVYVALTFLLFKTGHIIIPVVAPIGAAISTSVAGLLWQIVEEQKQKGRIKGMFGTYVPRAVVDRMVNSGEEPELGGIEENITAYFSDIQSFSSFSEKLTPPRLVELMNEFLTACTDIVQEEGGTLDKYIGDAVVAIYGAPLDLPGHPHKACVAALRVQRRIAELRTKWRGEGDKWPEIVKQLQTRIGLNTGPAVVGNMGSTTRFSYTMMGDNVNLAARMESGAKSWGAYTMCAEATRVDSEKIDTSKVVFRKLGRIKVKGRSTPVPIHEVMAFSEDMTDSMRTCVTVFEQALEKYFACDWDGATAMFRQSEPLEPNGPGRVPGTHTNPSLVYLSIIEGYRSDPPPAGWDGVYEMTEK